MERRLPALLPEEQDRPETVHRAMRYATLGTGKRVRPVLTLAVAEMLGAPESDDVVDLACSVELVHACSLVLDVMRKERDAVASARRAAADSGAADRTSSKPKRGSGTKSPGRKSPRATGSAARRSSAKTR